MDSYFTDISESREISSYVAYPPFGWDVLAEQCIVAKKCFRYEEREKSTWGGERPKFVIPRQRSRIIFGLFS
ncbi:MAG: hypothetical protein H7835_19975 [Magnetococcus sp. XQGC-1]